jgi:hypothetical protein
MKMEGMLQVVRAREFVRKYRKCMIMTYGATNRTSGNCEFNDFVRRQDVNAPGRQKVLSSLSAT